MGGGRAIDTAKAAAHYAAKPVITLPTIPATCAAATALSVLHHPGLTAYDPFLFLDAPPLHVFIHTGILAASPAMYLRAGIGDSLTKHVEAAYKAGDEALGYNDRLGLAVARMGYEALMAVGEAALDDAKRGLDSAAFRLACQMCIINTGLVSLLVQDRFNGGLAHALYYALHELPEVARHLHGDVVAWGSLVQLCLEGKEDQALLLRDFLGRLDIPCTLQGLGIALDDARLLALLPDALSQQDMADAPGKVDEAMLRRALIKAETLG
jgi:glycerol dehydrogenase